MLQRTFRLPSSVRMKNAQTIATPFFLVKIAPNNLDVPRFGFIVSKKVDKRAVVRNRIKRQIRYGVESHLTTIKPGYDVLFVIKQAAVGQETTILCEEVRKVLTKGRLL